jgi:hypothetical protein
MIPTKFSVNRTVRCVLLRTHFDEHKWKTDVSLNTTTIDNAYRFVRQTLTSVYARFKQRTQAKRRTITGIVNRPKIIAGSHSCTTTVARC